MGFCTTFIIHSFVEFITILRVFFFVFMYTIVSDLHAFVIMVRFINIIVFMGNVFGIH